MTQDADIVDFDPIVSLALAASVEQHEPGPDLKRKLMQRLAEPAIPAGFAFHHASDDRWLPHPVPGIRMKVLALNKKSGYATLLLDVEPGTRFPAHHHGGAEECYVVSGSIFTCGRRLGPGDFVHADADTDHGELWTDEGAQVILIVPPEEHLPASMLA
ncbi:MAG TPA: cupin domain-containing protein [Vicinamibacterales bacterium]|jgi:anti-sigma factor ChrR (cupin superfamily)|nr:cupin domain-containing protein [Vicinamibacterales bacterium]